MERTRVFGWAAIAAWSIGTCAWAAPPAERLKPIEKQLAKKIPMKVAVPLDRVLAYLQRESGIPFVIDRRALGGLLTHDIEMNVESITIKDALELALSQVSRAGADYDVRKGRLFISTPAQVLRPYLVTRVYDVRAMTTRMPNFTGQPYLSLEDQVFGSASSGGGGSPFDDAGGANEEEIADIAGETVERMTDMIRNSVRLGEYQGNWEIEGVSISGQNGLIVVVNTLEIQEGVAALLKRFEAASGKLVVINAKFLMVPNKLMDTFVSKEGLVLDAKKTAEFFALVSAPEKGVKLLGTNRNVCFNTQRVFISAGNETAITSDLEPVLVGGNDEGGAISAVDPELSILNRQAVLAVQPTADFSNDKISIQIRGGVVLGGSHRGKKIDHRTVAKGQAKAEVGTELDLPEQDLVKFRTSVRVPNGGAVLLAGQSVLFKHQKPADGEVVLFLQASVKQ